MANEKEVEIIGQATDSEDVSALKAEISRLKEENVNLTTENKKLASERKTYEGWWLNGNAEIKDLKAIIKVLVAYTKLA